MIWRVEGMAWQATIRKHQKDVLGNYNTRQDCSPSPNTPNDLIFCQTHLWIQHGGIVRAESHQQRLLVVGHLIVLSHIEDVLVVLIIVQSLVLLLWLIFLLLSFPLGFHFCNEL